MHYFFQLIQNFILAMKSGQLPQLGVWTYLVLAVVVAVEGPVATLLGAALASAGLMRPWLVFIAASIGNLTADSLWYTLGYAGKLEWALRLGRRLGLRPEMLERLEQGMHEHAARILFFAKLTVSFMIPSLVAAGLVKVPWRRWFPALFAGEMIWTGSLVLIGYYTTEAIKRVEQAVEYAVLTLSLVFVIFMLWEGRHLLRQLLKINGTDQHPGK
ncbi:MAG: VTT domain-containing protein [Anaerolineales bacterium]|jgi:membrane protein DedA with SNARE-associated domain